MEQAKARQLYELADRLSKIDESSLSPEQLEERKRMITMLQGELKKAKGVAEEVDQLDEISKDTLSSYMAKAQASKNDMTKDSDYHKLLSRKGSKDARGYHSDKHDELERKIVKRGTGWNKAYDRMKKEGVAEGFKNTYSVGDRVDGPLGTGTIVAVSKNIDVDDKVKVKLDDPSQAGEDGKFKDTFILTTSMLTHINEESAAEQTQEHVIQQEAYERLYKVFDFSNFKAE